MEPFVRGEDDDNWAPLEVSDKFGKVIIEIDGDEYVFSHELDRASVEAFVLWLQTWLAKARQ